MSMELPLYHVHLDGVERWLKAKEHFVMMVIWCMAFDAYDSLIFETWNLIVFVVVIQRNFLDYDMATQRMCVQRGPSDSEDRCAHTIYNFKKVYMCFCQGDLCNAAINFAPNIYQIALITIGIAIQHLVLAHRS